MAFGSFAVLFLCVGALGHLSGSWSAAQDEKCRLDHVELTEKSQLKDLADWIQTAPACPESLREAILELHLLSSETTLGQPEYGDFCSQARANKLADFHRKYLSASALVELPGNARRFFVAFGLKLSQVCRKQALGLLVRDSQRLLQDADYAELAELVDENGLLNEVIGRPKRPDEFAVPRNLVKALQHAHSGDRKRLTLLTKTTKTLRRVKTVCKRRFEPLYSGLLSPVLTLSAVGFNFGRPDERPHDEASDNAALQWYRIVFLCVSLNRVELVESLKLTSGKELFLSILTKAEADEWRAREPHLFKGEELDPSVAQLEYEADLSAANTSPALLANQVIDPQDRTLAKSLAKFKVQSGKLLNSRYLRRVFSTASSRLKRALVRFDSTGKVNAYTNTDELLELVDERNRPGFRSCFFDRHKRSKKVLTVLVFALAVLLFGALAAGVMGVNISLLAG